MTPGERAILHKLKEAAANTSCTCDRDPICHCDFTIAQEDYEIAACAAVPALLDDIEQLERSKRILEGDYNKLHDELISAESDAREAVKTRDRVLARCERLETALRNLCGRLDEIETHPSYKSLFTMTFIHGAGQYNGPNWAEPYERAREALAATAKEEH